MGAHPVTISHRTRTAGEPGFDVRACQNQYPVLKQAILAYYGHSLAARAQRFHDWRFDLQGAVRTQISQHGRLIRRWLADGEGPSLLDRVLIDSTIRQLPPEAQRTLAHNHPDTVGKLVQHHQNWQVAVTAEFQPPGPRAACRDTEGPSRTDGRASTEAADHTQEN